MRAEAELKEGSVHLDYEIWMLMETIERLRREDRLPQDELLRRALLESWLAHVRALLDFFRRPNPKYPRDMRAVDYFDHDAAAREEIEKLAPAKDSDDEFRFRDISQALAHLVYGRDKLNTVWTEDDQWMVVSKLNRFFAVLRPEQRSWFVRSEKYFSEGGA